MPWNELAEKSILLTLLSVIVAEILPSVHLSAFDIALGVVALVAANLAIATWGGRSAFRAAAGDQLPPDLCGQPRAIGPRNLPLVAGLFFAYLTTLIVVLYDTYRPVRAVRDGL